MASGSASSCSLYSPRASEARRWSASSASRSSGLAKRMLSSARPDITAGSILDRLKLSFARNPSAFGLHRFAAQSLQPFDPVGPPASLVLVRVGDEFLQRRGRLVAGPILVFFRSGRIDHAGNVARSGEDEAGRPFEDL